MKILAASLASFFAFYSCGTNAESTSTPVAQATPTPPANASGRSGKVPELLGTPERADTAVNEPKTVMDFFERLPEKYFTLEGCDRATDQDCKKARAEYLKTFTQVSDVKNGYFKGGCDGAQSCIEMAIFKKPDGTYLVGVATAFEMGNDFRFLDYAGGAWNDVSASVVPDYSKKNWYELPRIGTTMKVYAKKITEQGADYEVSEKGRLLYSLEWKNGKFERVK